MTRSLYSVIMSRADGSRRWSRRFDISGFIPGKFRLLPLPAWISRIRAMRRDGPIASQDFPVKARSSATTAVGVVNAPLEWMNGDDQWLASGQTPKGPWLYRQSSGRRTSGRSLQRLSCLSALLRVQPILRAVLDAMRGRRLTEDEFGLRVVRGAWALPQRTRFGDRVSLDG